MGAFTLDTLGVVVVDGVRVGWDATTSPSGFYLDAFTQGYVEAALLSAHAAICPEHTHAADCAPKLTWLSPETLAAILKDCGGNRGDREMGAAFWRDRQSRKLWPVWPPLTATLGDDGKVYLRETTQ